MKKPFIIISIFILLISSTACSNKKVIADENWQEIVNHQFSNYEVWAGCGLYFYEEDSKTYCDYMVYGSGVRIVQKYTREVKIDANNQLYFSMPENVILQQLIECSDSDESVEYDILIDQESIILDGIVFTRDEQVMID